MKSSFISLILLALFLAACSPSPSGRSITAITVSVSTAVPQLGTLSPPDLTPPPISPTTLPSLPAVLPPTELKYRLLADFPDFFFCDPDYYPVARADETVMALQHFPELQANQEEFQAILAHNGFTGLTAFTEDQMLLIYQEHKRLAGMLFELAGDAYRFQLQEAKGEGEQGFIITGTIDGQGHITVADRQPGVAACPICLAAHTLILTPHGPVPVEDLRQGDVIWTLDASGELRRARVLRVARRFAPASHEVVHLVLSDGRQLWASPGHPTADGRKLGDLRVGDFLDGSRLVLIERLAYDQPATYDVLPSGGTGLYWADGILLGSTLK